MASTVNLTARTIFLLRKSFADTFPQSNNNQYDFKELSRLLFPRVEYTEEEQMDVERWLNAAAQLESSASDPSEIERHLSSLNSHLSTRTTILGSKPSISDIAVFAQLSHLISKWSDDQRTGGNGYHCIVRHVDFVQNAPIFGLHLDEKSKVDINLEHVVVPMKPLDVKAEKQKLKKSCEASVPVSTDTKSTKGVVVMEGRKPENSVGDGEEANSTLRQIEKEKGKKNQDQKKAKQTKQPKQLKSASVPEKTFSPALIDLRVGHILKAENHPNADSLYVSTVDCGDPPGTENTSEYEGKVVRTVCSGLNGLVPLEEMQNRKIVAVCNLKPVTMRGIKSAAMVLAASPKPSSGEEDHHKGPVELVAPPLDSEAGDRVLFEGWEGEPETQLNPKKKVWENCQVGFMTTENCEVAFDAAPVEQLAGQTGISKLTTQKGICTVKSLKGATVR